MLNINKKTARKRRARARLTSSKDRLRLTVFRSNKYIYGQVINDVEGKTVAAFSSKNLTKEQLKGKSMVQTAEMVGEELAKLAKKAKVKSVVFDRGSYKYHGAVRALAEGARKGGLEF